MMMGNQLQDSHVPLSRIEIATINLHSALLVLWYWAQFEGASARFNSGNHLGVLCILVMPVLVHNYLTLSKHSSDRGMKISQVLFSCSSLLYLFLFLGVISRLHGKQLQALLMLSVFISTGLNLVLSLRRQGGFRRFGAEELSAQGSRKSAVFGRNLGHHSFDRLVHVITCVIILYAFFDAAYQYPFEKSREPSVEFFLNMVPRFSLYVLPALVGSAMVLFMGNSVVAIRLAQAAYTHIAVFWFIIAFDPARHSEVEHFQQQLSRLIFLASLALAVHLLFTLDRHFPRRMQTSGDIDQQ